VAVSLIGICWAVACWVPFAIIMEVSGTIHPDTLLVLIIAPQQFLKELDSPPPQRPTAPVNRRASHTRTNSSPNLLRTTLLSERQPLLTRRRSFDQTDNGGTQKRAPVAGGTILGIHNLAIVSPQFLVRSLRLSRISRYFFLTVFSVRPLLHRVRSSGSQMLKLTSIRQIPTLTMVRMA